MNRICIKIGLEIYCRGSATCLEGCSTCREKHAKLKQKLCFDQSYLHQSWIRNLLLRECNMPGGVLRLHLLIQLLWVTDQGKIMTERIC